MSFLQCFNYKQTWAFAIGNFMTDGVCRFFLFLDSFLSEHAVRYQNFRWLGYSFDFHIVCYHDALNLRRKTTHYHYQENRSESLCGTYARHVNFCFLPSVGIAGTAFGHYLSLVSVILIGIGGAAHQSWSANIFSTVGDMFPKTAIATSSRYRWHGRWHRLYGTSIRCSELFVYARRNQYGIYGL